jgi:hypothetical protein
MENSEKILFGDDAPQWYIALGEKWVGPLTASDVYERIQRQEITWAHYVWKKGQASWKRICDTKPFEAAVPHQPAKTVQKEIKAAVAPVVKQAAVRERLEPRNWYLHYNDSQFGPFSTDEVQQFLKSGKINSRVYAWKEGMANWEPLERIDPFRHQTQKTQTKAPPPPAASRDLRTNPRRPLIAKILMSDDQSVIVGVCRDISIGGLQVLTEQIPGKVGSKLKMNISPSTNDSGTRIEPFVAQGMIVRILEDGRGFSFRFEPLSEKAKKSVECYIDSPV